MHIPRRGFVATRPKKAEGRCGRSPRSCFSAFRRLPTVLMISASDLLGSMNIWTHNLSPHAEAKQKKR